VEADDEAVDRSRQRTLTEAAIVAVGAALAVVVGASGAPGWRALRVVLVLGLTVAAVRLVPRLERSGRLAVATVVGWLGVSIGIGLGVPWLVDGAVAVESVTASVALVAGLVALVLGGATLVTSFGGWARLTIVPWFVVVALACFSTAIAVAVTNVAPSDGVEASPADVDLEYADVTMRTADGVDLAGWYLPTRNGAAVVVRHGAGSERSSALDQAAVLAGAGYGVLIVDARGHGSSDGRAMDLGWFGDLDTAAAVDHLASRPGVDADRIAVLGLSMGGEEAIGAAAADERIAAVVAEGATGRTAADKTWLSDEYGVVGWFQEQIDRPTYLLVDLFTDASPPRSLEDAVRDASATPFLLIAAGDVPEEQQVGERLVAAGDGNVDLWVVDGAGHTDGLATDPAGWRRRVVGFLDASLLGDG
jgi:fermentation-respiration switch protein FrsA (DUF1100 family)